MESCGKRINLMARHDDRAIDEPELVYVDSEGFNFIKVIR